MLTRGFRISEELFRCVEGVYLMYTTETKRERCPKDGKAMVTFTDKFTLRIERINFMKYNETIVPSPRFLFGAYPVTLWSSANGHTPSSLRNNHSKINRPRINIYY